MADTVSPATTASVQAGTDRPLPHNQEAEVATLGAMILDPAEAIDVALTNRAMATRASTLGAKARAEDGVASTVEAMTRSLA